MKLKRREEDKFFYYLKQILRKIYKKIKSKRVKIFFYCLVGITLLTMGTFVGLIASGFFGTLDEPSERGLAILHELHIPNLRAIKIQIKGIMAENIKIPFNYIKGQFSKPEKIYIDMAFEDMKKIEYKRKGALEKGLLVSSEEDYVPATISYGDKQVNVKLRLKGDVIDHISGNKWSFRIKVKGDETLFGMKTFSIQKPEIRNYLDEFVYHKTLKREGVMSIRYDFIEVDINGENKGVYAIEEHFDTQLIGDNQRREGVIVRFEDNVFHEEVLRIYDLNTNTDINQLMKETFYLSNIETFYSNEKTLEDPELARQFIRAKDLLEAFRKGVLKTHEVFDVEKLSKYFAVSTLMVAEQAASFDDMRFYYNPITDHLEPIGFNALPNMDEVGSALKVFIPSYFGENNFSEESKKLSDLIFEDEIFYKSYIKELDRVSQKDYLDTLFLGLDEEIQKNTNILHKDYPFYHFSKETYYQNQEALKSKLNPVKSLNAFLQETSPAQNKIILSIANANLFPLEIVNLAYNNSVIFELNQGNNILKPRGSETLNYEKFEFRIPTGFDWDANSSFLLQVNYKIYGLENELNEAVSPWPYTEEDFLEKDFIRLGSILNSSDFLEINEDKKIISIKQGQWILDKSMIIPEGFTFNINEGTTLNLINSATIVSYSRLQFLGTEATPIKIISSDGTGQGLVVLNAGGESQLNYVYFKNLKNPSKESWELTGAITFYKSPFKFDHVVIEGMKSEDSLDGFDSKYEIKNSIFKNCFSDCLDDDFGGGLIESTSFTDCGNDCLDISGANVSVRDIRINNAGDKGISLGEKSNLFGEQIQINKGYIGIASKDLSVAEIKEVEISNCEYGLAVYQKKSEFGSAEIRAFETKLSLNKENYLVEKKSSLYLNDMIIMGNKEGIFEELYPL